MDQAYVMRTIAIIVVGGVNMAIISRLRRDETRELVLEWLTARSLRVVDGGEFKVSSWRWPERVQVDVEDMHGSRKRMELTLHWYLGRSRRFLEVSCVAVRDPDCSSHAAQDGDR